MDHKLIKIDGTFCVEEVTLPWSSNIKNAMLIYRYPSGDIDLVTEPGEHMHSSLYDLYQMSDDLSDGDTFSLDGVVIYKCEGVHVIPVDPSPPAPAQET